MTDMNSCPFNLLLEKNLPHIVANLFLSLDYNSFKSCTLVSKAWMSMLTSDTFKSIGKARFEQWLLRAVIFGHTNAVRHLLRLGAQPDLAMGRSSLKTALHYAALLNKTTIASMLLDAGANPNSKDSLKRSPLYYATAAKEGRSLPNNTFDMLMNNGAIPELMISK